MRCALAALFNQSVFQYSGSQVSVDQVDYAFVRDPIAKLTQQPGMIDFIEKLAQIHIHYPSFVFVDVGLGFAYCLLSIAPRAKTIAIVRKRRVVQGTKHLV